MVDDENLNTLEEEERLNNLEARMGRLEGRMRALSNSVDELRKEIEGAFFGTETDPERLQRMKQIGLLGKLDEIANILRERLPDSE